MSMCKILWVVTLWAVILSCCLLCTSKSQGFTRCGVRSVFKRARIVGGRPSYPGQWPWQIAIFKTAGSGKRKFVCGGALIHARWVLTAAHCFYRANPKSYTIIAGDYDIGVKDSTEQERRIRKIILHPRYRHIPYLENDIALVELSQTFNLTTGYVTTICLPGAGDNLSTPGAVVHVAGWGATRLFGPLSAILLHSSYQIQSKSKCQRATTNYLNHKVTFCAGDGQGGNDTCQGDSGGSLIRNVLRNGRQRWVAVGLVSWGEGCALVGKYGYNTRVEPFVNWIRKALTSCSDPGQPRNGRRRGVNFAHRGVIQFICDPGYELFGEQSIRCNNGKWSHPVPTCENCRSALGMQSLKIPQGNIQASSSRWYYTIRYGRLNRPYAWCSGTARQPYLQIDLGKLYKITGVATQGSTYINKWVKKYIVQSSLAGSSFTIYRENKQNKIFIGNTDKGSVVKNKLKHPVIARRIRIYPQKQGGFSYSNPACMRVEIYGCDIPSGAGK